MKTPKNYQSVIEKIQKSAQKAGIVVYAAGGFVRDLILNRAPNDLDIMAEGDNAGINFAKALKQDYGLSEPVIFERFGTAKLIIDGVEVEFVRARKEYYADNSRNPDTEIGTLEQDALRRDFTVNALFLRLNDMEILDLTGKGFSDISKKILRVTDENAAEIIFSQDPLRILRALRQSLQLGFSIEENTFKALVKNVKRISIVSPERVRDELNKILVCIAPSKTFVQMADIGLLKEILPEIDILRGLSQPAKYHDKDVFFHTMDVLDRAEGDLILALSALLHDSGKYYTARTDENGKISFIGHEIKSAEIAVSVLERLKYSGEVAASVEFIIKNHMRPNSYNANWGDGAVRRYVSKMGKFLPYMEKFASMDYGKSDTKPSALALSERIKKLNATGELHFDKNLVTGTDIIKFFNRPQGKWIGEVKNYIYNLQAENPKLSKNELLDRAKKFLKKL
jgi:tRNA nucleotidyltransferase/poly(A) polymerase